MPKAKKVNTTGDGPIISGKTAVAMMDTVAGLKESAAHPDAALLAAGAELVAIQADNAKTPAFNDRRELLKRLILDCEPQTLSGCRGRLQAIQAAWPDIRERKYGSPKLPEDLAYWRDWARLPEEKQGEKFRAEMKQRMSTWYPPIAPEEVVKRAIEAARRRAAGVFDGLKLLEVMAGNEAGPVEVESDTLLWIAEKFKADADDIQTDLDHAQHAADGKLYEDTNKRYAQKDAA